MQVNWYIRAPSPEIGFIDEDTNLYMGKALIRKGRVHFYDRYPCGGRPFRVSDFTDDEFRKRAELISHNIESLLETFSEKFKVE